jgi:hypothetical protein
VIKAFDKKGPHACKFSVKYMDDPNWLTHSLLRESVLFIGSRFSNLYTAVDTPAKVA